MFKVLIVFSITLLSSVVFAELQAQTLEIDSLYNNKTFIVDNFVKNKGIKFKLKTVNKSEPAMLPIYLYPFVKCNKKAKYKPVDLAAMIVKSYPADFSRMIGAPTASFPSGVLHVCAVENVNFDNNKLFISIFEPGSEECDRSKVLDLIFPLEAFCKK